MHGLPGEANALSTLLSEEVARGAERPSWQAQVSGRCQRGWFQWLPRASPERLLRQSPIELRVEPKFFSRPSHRILRPQLCFKSRRTHLRVRSSSAVNLSTSPIGEPPGALGSSPIGELPTTPLAHWFGRLRSQRCFKSRRTHLREKEPLACTAAKGHTGCCH